MEDEGKEWRKVPSEDIPRVRAANERAKVRCEPRRPTPPHSAGTSLAPRCASEVGPSHTAAVHLSSAAFQGAGGSEADATGGTDVPDGTDVTIVTEVTGLISVTGGSEADDALAARVDVT